MHIEVLTMCISEHILAALEAKMRTVAKEMTLLPSKWVARIIREKPHVYLPTILRQQNSQFKLSHKAGKIEAWK